MDAPCAVYPALYTKSTAKKKKKGWLDGSVTISENVAVLKDDDGNEICKTKLGSHELIKATPDWLQCSTVQACCCCCCCCCRRHRRAHVGNVSHFDHDVDYLSLLSLTLVQANQDNIQIFEGLTCMTLGEDSEAGALQQKVSRKTRHPMRNVKHAVSGDLSTVHGSQAHSVPADAAQMPACNDTNHLMAGRAVLHRRHCCIESRRSDDAVLEAFTHLAHERL
eukprot:jgi/Ulvmu1/8220/UM041_0029.1